MLFTVNEIASRLAVPKEQSALKERIRHWTREGLLVPVGEKNPGTGRHRLYDESVLFDVAILNSLAGLGIQVRGQHEMLRLVRKAIKLGDEFEWLAKGAKKGSMVYLAISSDGRPDDPPRVRVFRADLINERARTYSMEEDRDAAASLYINVTRIHQMIEQLRVKSWPLVGW